MRSSFEETLIEVWRQVLIEDATVVKLGVIQCDGLWPPPAAGGFHGRWEGEALRKLRA